LKKDLYYMSMDGVHKIHAVIYTPEVKPVAVLQIVHGMVEYIERYDEFAEYLTQFGIVVVGADMLGHGKSVSSEAEWGHIPGSNPSNLIVKDVHKLRVNTEKKYKELPYFIMGHSMGSYIVKKYLSIYGKNLKGAILMGSGQVQDIGTGFGLFVSGKLAKKHDATYRSDFLRKLTFTPAYSKYDTEGEDYENSWLTRDAAEVEKYFSDPACTAIFSVNAYKALFDTVMFDNKTKNIDKIDKSLPILFISGDSDPVGANSKSVKSTAKRYEKLGIKDIDVLLYKGARHELVHELNKKEVFQDIRFWLFNKLNK